MNKNIFVGGSFRVRYAKSIYGFLMSREWFTYTDVQNAQNATRRQFSKSEAMTSIAKTKHYSELKKAFMDVRGAIFERLNDMTCIEVRGNNRSKEFRYVGAVPSPLEDMLNVDKVMRLKDYYKFCLDSAGLLPQVWLEYYFKDHQDLVDMKNKKRTGEQTIGVSIDRQQQNIHLFPQLYEAIDKKVVLEIAYKPFDEEQGDLVFHPHFLKEHNGRWFVLGHAEEKDSEFGCYVLALDRIQGTPVELKEKIYCKAPPHFYENYFKNIVGISHRKNTVVEQVILRAYGNYMFHLVNTKRIHESQELFTPLGVYDGVEYGEFKLQIEPNNEFRGRILTMGGDLEIISPPHLRQEFADEAKRLLGRYKKE